MRYPKDGVLTPNMLREMADMMEKKEAYGDVILEINDESHIPEYLGKDGYDRAYRRWLDKSITIRVTLLGSVEVQTPNGDWVVYR